MYPGFGGSRTVQPLLLSNIALPVLVARCPLCPGLLPLRVCPPAASALVCPPFIHQLYPHVAPDENSHGYPGPPRSSPSCQTFSSHLNKISLQLYYSLSIIQTQLFTTTSLLCLHYLLQNCQTLTLSLTPLPFTLSI